MSSLRRSARERKQPKSIYAEAALNENDISTPHKGSERKIKKSRQKATFAIKRKYVAGAVSDDEEEAEKSEKEEEVDDEENHGGEVEDNPVEEEEPTDSDEDEESMEDSSSSTEGEDDDFKPVYATKTVSPKKKAIASPSTPAAPKQQIIRLTKSPLFQKKSSHRTENKSAPRKKVATHMLNAAKRILGAKMLQQQDSEGLPLLVRLLQTYKLGGTSNSNTTPLLHHLFESAPQTPYHYALTGDCIPLDDSKGSVMTTSPKPQALQVEDLARSVIKMPDVNEAHCLLLNFLFSSIGGFTDGMQQLLDPAKHNLEDMTNGAWIDLLHQAVDWMRSAPPDHVLLSADPHGIKGSDKHAIPVLSLEERNLPLSVMETVSREYRRLYSEFWYVLALLALSEGSGNKSNGGTSTLNDMGMEPSDDEIEDASSTGDEQSLDKHKKKKVKKLDTRKKDTSFKERMSLGTPSRFEAAFVRDVIHRVSELVSVGQPDIRAAATLATLQMGHAILERTVQLRHKLEVAQRQLEAAKKGRRKTIEPGSKAESLQHVVESLKRACEELEELVLGPVTNGLFMHRYRDSHPYIRATCLAALSKMTLTRPDLFLRDKYLKYFGWMMSDKVEVVRFHALQGLLHPFDASSNIDLSLMAHVTAKFLKRIAECARDASVNVQEQAMRLLLLMLRNGFLDDLEDDLVWDSINLRAIAAHDCSHKVRRDALYFIMEQLEPFEEDSDVADNRKKSKATNLESVERLATQRLDALASWLASSLTDGPVPLDNIRIELTDFLVVSLRNMHEHKDLAENWSAMLRAIREDSSASMDGTTMGDRVDVAKQRVLVRFLATAALAQVGAVANSGFLSNENNSEFVLTSPSHIEPKKINRRASSHVPHETLSVALLKALPEFLVKFNSDAAILESLTRLPRYLLPSVFSLPQRQQEFAKLLQNLSSVFLQTQDDEILGNVAISLAHFAQGGHMRVGDVQIHLKHVVTNLEEKALQFIDAKEEVSNQSETPTQVAESLTSRRRSARLSSKSSEGSTDIGQTATLATEAEENASFSFALTLRRLTILTKRTNTLEWITSDMMEILKQYLMDMPQNCKRQRKSGRYYQSMANSFQDGLGLLLCCAGWKVHTILNVLGLLPGTDSDDAASKNVEGDEVLKSITQTTLELRDNIISIISNAMNQDEVINDGDEESTYVSHPAERAFAASVQLTCSHVCNDLRCLFPKEWAHSASHELRSLALNNEGKLIAASVRCLRANEQHLQFTADQERESVQALLLPIARSIVTNWIGFGNRREAGVALVYLTKGGKESAALISTMNKILKRGEPVRFLEAQMACLRQAYDEWINNEPEDLESDHPTEEEMTRYDQAEKAHNEHFLALEILSSKLSQTLGVGKLPSNLMTGITGFLKEGIRFAFSTDDDGELILGSRLSFLSLVAKYAIWVKKIKATRMEIEIDLQMRERSLRRHPEFLEVHEDDLRSLSNFYAAFGIKQVGSESTIMTGTSTAATSFRQTQESTASSSKSPGSSAFATPISTLGRRKSSTSAISARSQHSNRSSLSPLYESTQKTQTTLGTEGDNSDGEESDTSYLDRKEKPISKSALDEKDSNSKESEIKSPSKKTHGDSDEDSHDDSILDRPASAPFKPKILDSNSASENEFLDQPSVDQENEEMSDYQEVKHNRKRLRSNPKQTTDELHEASASNSEGSVSS